MLRQTIHWYTENSPNTCYIRCVNVRGGGVESQERRESLGNRQGEKAVDGEARRAEEAGRKSGHGEGGAGISRITRYPIAREESEESGSGRPRGGEGQGREGRRGQGRREGEKFRREARSTGGGPAEGSGWREAGGEAASGANGQDSRAESAREVRYGNDGAVPLPRGRAARRGPDGASRLLRPARLVLRARTPLPRGGRRPQARKAPSRIHGLTR